jgi:hypothetical protein
MKYSSSIYQELCSKIKNVTKDTFDEVTLAVFRYQAQNNGLYQQFIKLLDISPDKITKVTEIPFLPISFFKHHLIKTQEWETKTIFRSSGTTLKSPAEHHIRSLAWYRNLSKITFEAQYGALDDYVILGLLPSYLEQGASSLVYMVEQFIQFSKQEESGFFLHDFAALAQTLKECEAKQKKVLLIGVTYALLDFAAGYPMALEHTIVMETGGMKGRRKEMTKQAVHQVLKKAFRLEQIHSEYGMTELLSQGYSSGQGRFDPAPTMQVLIREVTDPFHYVPYGKSGGINMVDLANIDSCAFIATDDLGKVYADGQFEVLGRLSAADLRGCNLMIGE